MLSTRIIPCLLNKNSGLVKTTRFRDPKYIGDPVNTIQIFNNFEVDEIIFLDITATNEKRKPSFGMVSKIVTECFVPLAYGGGIHDLGDAKKIFSLGVEKIVICTHAVENPGFIKAASGLFGSQSIVVSIDAKKNIFGKYEAFTNAGTKNAHVTPIDLAMRAEKLGAGEIFLNSIDRDGTMDGYDIDLIRSVASAVDIPVIACGGAGKIGDVADAIKKGGASAAAAGSLFVYQGKNRSVLINYPTRDEFDKILQ